MEFFDTLTAGLRDAIDEFGPGHNELSRRSGVPQATISRFAAGADIKLSTVDKLAKHLGIGFYHRGTIAAKAPKKGRGKAKPKS